jgi:ribonuclease PH
MITTRADGRLPDQLRPITFEPNFTRWAEGSVLAKFGETHVFCNVTIDNSLPNWLRYQPEPHGWLTAEYAMLPRSLNDERVSARPRASDHSTTPMQSRAH